MMSMELQSVFTQSPRKKTCFIISPIGETLSEARKRSDMLLEHIFTPAMEPLGYEVIRADKISEPGSITIQVIERILQAEIVIADLSDHNPNVFYELAVRHAANKGVIHIICSGQNIPFDVADLRTITVNLDIPGAARAIQEISAQAKQIEAGELGQTPIRLANVLQQFESRKSDDNLILREMLDRISELGSSIREVTEQQRVSSRQVEFFMDIAFRTDMLARHPSSNLLQKKSNDSNSALAKLLAATSKELNQRYQGLSPRKRDVVATSYERMAQSRQDLSPLEVARLVMQAVEEDQADMKAAKPETKE